MAVALDHIFRASSSSPANTVLCDRRLWRRRCAYYRVVLDEQRAIVHNSGQLISAAGAIQLATSWYHFAGVARHHCHAAGLAAQWADHQSAMRQVRP